MPTIALRRRLLQIAATAMGFPALLLAQGGHSHGTGHPPDSGHHATPPVVDPKGFDADAAEAATHTAMSGHVHGGPHMRLTPARAVTTADSARAAQVLTELRTAIARYKDVKAAEADGYRIFAPKLPQEVYHFTSTWRSIKESFRFDPSQPTSLLYRKTPSGTFELVGAMYHAPKRLPLEKLDQRIPLSIARWHAHTDLCVPKLREADRWTERRNGMPLFGPHGSITTRQQCNANGGRFHDQIFGWMVHVMPFETDPAKIWGADHSSSGSSHH